MPIKPATRWWPFVDDWFNHIPQMWYWILLVVGGASGLLYAGGAAATIDNAGLAAIGALLGLLTLPLLRIGVKILITVVILAVAALIVYLVAQALQLALA